MKTTLESKKSLLKRFHTICGKYGIDAERKKLIVYSFGVESSRELSENQLLQACSAVERTQPQRANDDQLRKRLIAAIGGYLRKISREQNIDLIKAIACRAAKRDIFNEIPREQLQNLYNGFLRKQKDLESVNRLVSEDLEIMSFLN